MQGTTSRTFDALGAAFATVSAYLPHRLDLTGRVALVTGGSRGLGLLIAEELGRRGASVAICGRDETALDAAARHLCQQGIDVFDRRVDIGDRAQAESFVGRVVKEWGRLDIVVNNAGVIQVEPAESVTVESLEDVMRSNFWGAVYTTFAALPRLRERPKEARVVNIVSVGGRVAVPHMLGYSASKFALMGFSEGLGAELAKAGVGVTTVIPGLMRTGSFYNAEFGGDQQSELAWFSLASSLPFLTMSADRAARLVVDAVESGKPLLHLGLPAAVLARAHGLAPSLTVRLMALANRFLPAPAQHPEASRKGREVPNDIVRSPLHFLGYRAAKKNNEAPPSAAAA